MKQVAILSYVTIMYQPVTVSSNTCSQTHVQTKHSLAHLQDLTLSLAGKNDEVGIKFCRCARECFTFICIWLHVFELTVIGWCIIVT